MTKGVVHRGGAKKRLNHYGTPTAMEGLFFLRKKKRLFSEVEGKVEAAARVHKRQIFLSKGQRGGGGEG